MSVYINGTGIISPQRTHDKSVLQNKLVTFNGNRWQCDEPDYSQFIDGKQIRRMSRIIRMGIVSSLLASRESAVEKPEAIIVGTAFGCLEDTYSFLSKLVQYKEDMLSPTAFIHSTHNTIAAQIALLFQSRGYNSTYVHRALSFESALNDALMLIEEGSVENVLVGGIDEITDTGFNIMNRMGFYKAADAIQENNFYSNSGKGSAAGEGSAFFSLSVNQSSTSYAKIVAVETLSFMSTEDAIARAISMLETNGIQKPDLLITGHNGDHSNDTLNDKFAGMLNCDDRKLKYKQWCGEYATATAFATWMSAEILKGKTIPDCFQGIVNSETPVKNIMIYNQQDALHHSLILLQSC